MHENPEPTSEGPKTSQSNGRPAPQKGTGVDYYEILGVASTADKKDIRTAYRTLALKWHPDVSNQNDAETVFLKIRKAYGIPFCFCPSLTESKTCCRIPSLEDYTISMALKRWRRCRMPTQATAMPIDSGTNSSPLPNKAEKQKPETPDGIPSF